MTAPTGRPKGPGSEGAKKGWDTRRLKNSAGVNPEKPFGRPRGSGTSLIREKLTEQYAAQGITLRQALIDAYNQARTLRGAAELMGVEYMTFRALLDAEQLACKTVLALTPAAEEAERQAA